MHDCPKCKDEEIAKAQLEIRRADQVNRRREREKAAREKMLAEVFEISGLDEETSYEVYSLWETYNENQGYF